MRRSGVSNENGSSIMSKLILIIEDNPQNMKLFRDVLVRILQLMMVSGVIHDVPFVPARGHSGGKGLRAGE